ncbi:MAG: DUF502 domain-containing protein [Desulfobulbaceae bacterium]|nr:DUF502 domain-containing protein [Desulfobulbaceae bacterium]
MGWVGTINRKLFAGVLAVLPILATIYLIYWGVTSIEGGLAVLLGLVLPEEAYRPGLGLVVGLSLILLAGIMVETFIVRKILGWFERAICKIPVVKIIYGSIRDLLAFVARGKDSGGGQAVWVSLGVGDLRMLGFVTRENMHEFSGDFHDRVVVYLPVSYQIGGYTVIVPRSQVTPAGIPFEKAMRFVMTAGVMDLGNDQTSAPITTNKETV